jgi:hypothetical protein
MDMDRAGVETVIYSTEATPQPIGFGPGPLDPEPNNQPTPKATTKRATSQKVAAKSAEGTESGPRAEAPGGPGDRTR